MRKNVWSVGHDPLGNAVVFHNGKCTGIPGIPGEGISAWSDPTTHEVIFISTTAGLYRVLDRHASPWVVERIEDKPL